MGENEDLKEVATSVEAQSSQGNSFLSSHSFSVTTTTAVIMATDALIARCKINQNAFSTTLTLPF